MNPTDEEVLIERIAEGSLDVETALVRLKATRDELERLEHVKRLLSQFLYEAGDLPTFDYEGRTYRPLVSVRTIPKVNLARLRAIDPSLFDAITVPKLDGTRLSRTLDAGRWTAELRDECVTFEESAPGVRFEERPNPTKESSE